MTEEGFVAEHTKAQQCTFVLHVVLAFMQSALPCIMVNSNLQLALDAISFTLIVIFCYVCVSVNVC